MNPGRRGAEDLEESVLRGSRRAGMSRRQDARAFGGVGIDPGRAGQYGPSGRAGSSLRPPFRTRELARTKGYGNPLGPPSHRIRPLFRTGTRAVCLPASGCGPPQSPKSTPQREVDDRPYGPDGSCAAIFRSDELRGARQQGCVSALHLIDIETSKLGFVAFGSRISNASCRRCRQGL